MENGKTKEKWVGILRAAIWMVILLSWSVGARLLAAGSSSKAIAEGMDGAFSGWGVALMIVSLLLLVWNFVWGMKRWAEKWYDRKWKVFGGIFRTVWGGVWRGVVFGAIIVFGMMVIAPKVEAGIAKGVLEKEEKAWIVGQKAVEEDFRQGNISPDEYLRYTLAVAYGMEEVPEKYRTEKKEPEPKILEILEKYGKDMSLETIQEALDVATLANIKVGLDASGNVARSEDGLVKKALDLVLGVENVKAYTKDTKTLNKVKLSENKNFLVFYTDTGSDAITDEQAEKLAVMLERIVEGYKREFGMEYNYEMIVTEGDSEVAMRAVLYHHGLDVDLYKTAMPVYVANPFKNGSNVLAFYTNTNLTKILQGILVEIASWFPAGSETVDRSKYMSSMIGVPNITILPSNVDDENLEIVTAHEMGHHYQSLYCLENSGDECASGAFISETSAQWMAAHVAEEQPEDDNFLRGHLDNYVRIGTCYRIDESLSEPPAEDACHTQGANVGYPTFVFLQNYEDVVADGKGKIWKALMQKDTLGYLRGQATEEEFREVMRRLAQKNLTNEYEHISLQAMNIPRGVDLDCEGKMMCSAEFALRPTAIKYIYLATEEYDRVKVTVTGTADDVISIIGKKGGKWEVVADGRGKMEYTAEKTGEYEVIAFAVANASVTDDGKFTIAAVVEEVEEMVDKEATAATETGYVDGCMVVDFQGMMDNFLSIGKSTFELLDMMGVETGDTSEFEQGITEAKQSMAGKRLMVCELQMKRGVSMDKVEEVARGAMWVSYRVMTMRDAGAEVRIVAGVDQARRQGKIVLLGEEEGKVYMLEIRVEEE